MTYGCIDKINQFNAGIDKAWITSMLPLISPTNNTVSTIYGIYYYLFIHNTGRRYDTVLIISCGHITPSVQRMQL